MRGTGSVGRRSPVRLTRRQTLLGLSALSLSAVACGSETPAARTTPKKGVGAWEFHSFRSALRQSGASWYFNWRADPVTDARGAEFVPMIGGPGEVNGDSLATAVRSGTRLQGFNEPDLPEQANLPVDQALALWPQLMDTGLALGSPATSEPADTSAWMIAFMDGVRARNYRMDFVCAHWYDQRFEVARGVADLEAYLQRVHARFGLPVWLTEFAMIDWLSNDRPTYPNSERQAEYAAACVPMLEALPFVERYAWFSLPPPEEAPAVALFEPRAVITPVGRAYAQAG